MADLGAYFLVKKENEDILVRVQGENVAEEIITGKMEKKSDKIFVYDGNQYAAYKELISGKVSFVLYAKMESDGYELKLIKTDICAFVRCHSRPIS